ncbi:hypothetical protein M5689_010894 [Euphorbia peplus]|nr:hypothetical protein M5689_010894 [Euphorbia peplus]
MAPRNPKSKHASSSKRSNLFREVSQRRRVITDWIDDEDTSSNSLHQPSTKITYENLAHAIPIPRNPLPGPGDWNILLPQVDSIMTTKKLDDLQQNSQVEEDEVSIPTERGESIYWCPSYVCYVSHFVREWPEI